MKTNRLMTVVAAIVLAGASLSAISPKWNSGPTLTFDGTNLYLSGKATGLGNAGGFVNFTVSGSIDVSSRCYTKKGNTPQAANKQEQIAVDKDFSSPISNGQTTLDEVFIVSVESTLQCPGGQHVVVESVNVNDLVLEADSPYEALNTPLSL